MLSGFSLRMPYAQDDLTLIANLRQGQSLQRSFWFESDRVACASGLKKNVAAARLSHPFTDEEELVCHLIGDALVNAGLSPESLSGERVRVYLTGLGPRVDRQDYGLFYDHNAIEDLKIQTRITRLHATNLAQDRLGHRVARKYALCRMPPCLHCSSNSALAAVHLGIQAINSGEIDIVLVVNGSAVATQDLVFLDSQSMLDGERTQPFCEESRSVLPSEGFAALVLESERHRARRTAEGGIRLVSDYLQMSASRTNDASQLTSGVLKVMHNTLAKADITAGSLCAVIPHANGSGVSDKAEAQALSSLLNGTTVPVLAYKGQIGYVTTGSGIIDMIIGHHSLTQGELISPSGTGNIRSNIAGHLLINKGVIHHDKQHLLKVGLGVDGSIIGLLMSVSC